VNHRPARERCCSCPERPSSSSATYPLPARHPSAPAPASPRERRIKKPVPLGRPHQHRSAGRVFAGDRELAGGSGRPPRARSLTCGGEFPRRSEFCPGREAPHLPPCGHISHRYFSELFSTFFPPICLILSGIPGAPGAWLAPGPSAGRFWSRHGKFARRPAFTKTTPPLPTTAATLVSTVHRFDPVRLPRTPKAFRGFGTGRAHLGC